MGRHLSSATAPSEPTQSSPPPSLAMDPGVLIGEISARLAKSPGIAPREIGRRLAGELIPLIALYVPADVREVLVGVAEALVATDGKGTPQPTGHA